MRSAGGRATKRTAPSIASFTDWLATYARDGEPGSLRVEEVGGLWDRIRAAQRETEALNLDRKLHILALFAEIAATAPGAEGFDQRAGGIAGPPLVVIPAKGEIQPPRKTAGCQLSLA